MKLVKTKKHMALFLVMVQLFLCVIIGNKEVCYAQNMVKFDTETVSVENTTSSETTEVQQVATEIDLGDYQTEMEVGDKQLLTTTLLPEGATGATITYTSSNTAVATVNGMGRITAISVGEVTITVASGTIVSTINVKVKAKTTETVVSVTDIEIGNYEPNLNVDKTMNIQATVLPSNATNTIISYSSSDVKIATVSSQGEVKGLAPGSVNITVSAGTIKKTVTLLVKVATAKINLSTSYVVLKIGDSKSVVASIEPANAPQGVTYSSKDKTVATVSGSGKITAVSAGSTTIVVTNGDMYNSITVIVNKESSLDKSKNNQVEEDKQDTSKLSELEDNLIGQFQEGKITTISIEDYSVITENILKNLYKTKAILCIEDEDYSIIINGKNIVNYANELSTDLNLKDTSKGTEFTINDHNNLPGKITVSMNKDKNKYLYLLNSKTKKYQNLQVKDTSNMNIDEAGKYLLTDKKVSSLTINKWIVIIAIVVIVMLCIGYVIMKKKYWFW